MNLNTKSIGNKTNSLKKKITRSSLAVLGFVALFVLIMGYRVNQDDAMASASLPPREAVYAVRGPHPVGMQTMEIVNETPIGIKMWYPAINDQKLEESIKYSYQMKLGAPFGLITVASYQGQALQSAPFDISTPAYPLVILSPGFSIGSLSYAWLAEHIASYGFVVVSPEHHEILDPGNELWKSTITRPQDILNVFSYLDEQIKPGGSLNGLVDTEQVAVIGHSYGGYTSLAAAGARIDTKTFQSQCESAREKNEPGTWLCDQLLPHMAEMVSMAGFGTTPEGLWDAWADPRVDAIVPMAGDAFFFGQEGLAEITVPVLAIGGTNDKDSPYEWGTHPSYEYSSGTKKALVALEGAEHMIFTGPCEKIPLYMKFFIKEFCSDGGWDRIYAHNLVKHFTTAFLLSELKQDTTAAAVLDPANVNFSDVTYESQGY